MEFLPQLLTLAGVILLACISPGPDFIAVTSHSLIARSSGIGAAIGVTCAIAVWSTLAVFGLGVMLSQMAWAYEIMRFVGAAYLIYIGLKMVAAMRRSTGIEVEGSSIVATSANEAERKHPAFIMSVRKGALVGLTNPKSMAFFGSLFVTVLPVGAPLWVYIMTIGVVVMVAISWFMTLAMIFSSSHVRNVYGRMRKPFDAVMGAALIGLGVKLAISK